MKKVRNPFAAPEDARNEEDLKVKTGVKAGKRPIIVEIAPHGPIVEIATDPTKPS